MSAPDVTPEATAEAMAGPRACFEQLIGWLEGDEAAALEHGQLEEQLDQRGRELLRQMLQGNLELRALRERNHSAVCESRWCVGISGDRVA